MLSLLFLLCTLIPSTLQCSHLASRWSQRTLAPVHLLGDASSTGLTLSIWVRDIAIIPDGQRSRFRIGSMSVIDQKNQVLLMDPLKYRIILDNNYPMNNNFEISLGNVNNLYWCPDCKSTGGLTKTESAKYIECS
jgi:hypothetical protein